MQYLQMLSNVHHQFAEFFESKSLKPFAFLVSKKLSEGHICLNLEDFSEQIGETPYTAQEVIDAAKKLKDEPLVTYKDGPKQPFVLHNNRLYLQRYFHYETLILQRIKSLARQQDGRIGIKNEELPAHRHFINSLFNDASRKEGVADVDNINWQLVAAISAVSNNFTIITGGPGTGKTTTVAKILAILVTINPDLTVALAAPTGKAAMRMAESLKASAGDAGAPLREKFESLAPVTIHRLLKWIPDPPYFKHDHKNPLNYDVVIVDESSMIDAALFARLLDAVGENTKLILLGDKDQLASVEAGSLFGDLCKTQIHSTLFSVERADFINSFISEPGKQIPPGLTASGSPHILAGHIIELRKSHRFTANTGIGRFSRAVIRNDRDTLLEYIQHGDEQVIIDTTYRAEKFDSFVEGYAEYINEPDIGLALKKLNQLRVLCAVREGEQGLYELNTRIENRLKRKKLIKNTTGFYENQPVIITRNYYSLGLFNGDVGIVRPDERGVLKAWFEGADGELKSVLPGYIAESETVYAMTIHKSQGSEYDQVLVILPDHTNLPLLTRELLYTAVTRARSRVIVQAPEAVIVHTAESVVQRASGIMERFNE